MTTTGRLVVYLAVLAVVFAVAFGVGRLVDPVHDAGPSPAHTDTHRHDTH